ncbi:MAG: hypothetical protein DYH08_10470 [Actinobacteria bacterium ATB1]|nr:hypothetical protein [Actinobacteria bacterium ATB1]
MPVVHVVPHTHWDREWYRPFQDFRRKLVGTLDELLELCEHEPSYRFMLDGQTAMIDDYLAIRPEARATLESLARSGRLDVGPWTALPDTLLVSGETIVRNLRSGIERSEAFGGPMRVAYMPDMFGHAAQMPQILAQFGFSRTVIWRGVPSEIDETLFKWHALDGSTQLTGYLAASYSNGVDLPTEPDDLLERVEALDRELRPFDRVGHLLVMNGTDHWPPQHGLAAAIEKADSTQGTYDIRLSSLPGWFDAALAAADLETMQEWTGELRSAARSNVLMGVTSTRTDLKRIQAEGERAVERYAEPLVALSGSLGQLPLLREAWERLVLNSAHDSVCSCSADPTMRQVHVRYEETVRIGQGVARDAFRALSKRIRTPETGSGQRGLLVWNPSPFARAGVIEAEVPLPPRREAHAEDLAVALVDTDGSRIPTVELGRRDEIAFDAVLTGTELDDIVNLVRSRVYGTTFVNGFHVAEGPKFVEVHLEGSSRLRGHVDADILADRLRELSAAEPERRFHVILRREPSARVQAHVQEIAPLGWSTFLPEWHVPEEGPATPIAGPGRLDNGLVRVEFEGDGTFRLTDPESGEVVVRGLGRIVDGGDVGDTYNWSPPEYDTVVTEPEKTVIEVVESTPLSGTIRVSRPYRIPAAATADCSRRNDDSTELVVAMTVSLDTSSPVVRVTVEFENTARDHRLRVHLPLPEPVDGSVADTAFGTVRRGLATEGGPTELPLPTWPAKRHVDCSGTSGGLAVLFDQTVEYEVLRDSPDGPGVEVALTLVRATGFLSRQAPRMRPNPAGPPVPTEHSQSAGPQVIRFGILCHRGDPEHDDVPRAADAFAHPLWHRPVEGSEDGDLPPACDPLELDTSDAVALSAVVPSGAGDLEIRLFNDGSAPGRVSLSGETDWCRAAGLAPPADVVDLRGAVVEPSAGVPLTLAPGRITTLRLLRNTPA